jgi:hypothetical protein
MPTIHDRLPLPLCSLLLAFAMTSAIRAQDPGEEDASPPTTVPEQVLGDEPREPVMPKVFIHGAEARLPSDMRAAPVQLVGIEDGGNGFRHRTPFLADGERRSAAVDVEKLRQRRLAVYPEPVDEDPAAPAAEVAENVEPVPEAAAPAPREAPRDVRRSVAMFRTVTIGTALAVLLGIGVLLLMRRRTGT